VFAHTGAAVVMTAAAMSAPTLSQAPPPPLSPRGGGGLQVREAGRALKVQHTDAPHLVSLGGGRLSTSVTLHPLPQGKFSIFGASICTNFVWLAMEYGTLFFASFFVQF
jgi:hypothetical protein